MNRSRSTARLVFLMLALVWAGTIIGVSFIATPVKFQAQSLTLPAGLEVGRYTFRLFSRVELCFLIGMTIAAVIARAGRIAVLALAAVAIQLLLQRFWLLPELDSGVSEILAGGPVQFSALHWLYAVFDLAKAALLITAAAITGAPKA